MSQLRVYDAASSDTPRHDTTQPDEICALLAPAGIRFEQWTATKDIVAGASQEEVLDAYRADVDTLCASGGYGTVDVISLSPDHADRVELRKKFLFEHTHSEDEVRFFVAGRGLFTMHVDGQVYEMLCTQGDLIRVPAGTKHWFDMGAAPEFVCIRFFDNTEGWVAQPTGDAIADRFHRLDDAVAS